jgi:predicted Ser/Thr protein kinase
MNQILESGQIVHTESGVSCQVGQFLGGGGQGEVYKADVSGKTVALKWYFPASRADLLA